MLFLVCNYQVVVVVVVDDKSLDLNYLCGYHKIEKKIYSPKFLRWFTIYVSTDRVTVT